MNADCTHACDSIKYRAFQPHRPFFMFSHLASGGHPAVTHACSSSTRHNTRPPSLTGFGTLPALRFAYHVALLIPHRRAAFAASIISGPISEIANAGSTLPAGVSVSVLMPAPR